MKKSVKVFLASLMIFAGLFGVETIFAEQININDISLVAYWTFDEENVKKTEEGYAIIDSSNYGNDGNSIGCKIVKGVFGNAMLFNGETDCAEFPLPRSLSLTFTDKMTVMFWISPIDVRGKKQYFIIGDDGSNSGWQISRYSNGNRFFFILGGIAPAPGIEEMVSKTATGRGPKGWTHVTATFDKSLPENNIKVYINGKCSLTDNGLFRCEDKKDDIKLSTGRSPISVGRFRACPSWGKLKGAIDELLMYKRCLTEKEIKADYERGKALSKQAAPFADAWLDMIDK